MIVLIGYWLFYGIEAAALMLWFGIALFGVAVVTGIIRDSPSADTSVAILAICTLVSAPWICYRVLRHPYRATALRRYLSARESERVRAAHRELRANDIDAGGVGS